MCVVLKHETKQINPAWMERCEGVGLAAHGFSEEVASASPRRVIRVFMAPLEREGILQEQLASLGIRFTPTAGETRLVLQ